MQQYFLNFFPTLLKSELIKNCKYIIDFLRTKNVPVVYTAQPGSMTPEQRGLLRDFWGSGMNADPQHARVAESVKPEQDETVLTKWRYSAFFNTQLGDILRESGRDQLIICGVYAHIGILVTAIEAYSRDLQTFLVKNAIADFSEDKHVMALQYAANCCSVITSVEEIIS